MRITLVCALICLLIQPAWSQEKVQPRWLIDSPTAGLLPRGSFAVDVRLYEGNGILTQMEMGVFDRASVGFSFGGQHIVGNQGARWNPRVEFAGRIRVLEETTGFPALVVGYDSQGYGAYNSDLGRYTTKSKGLYAVLSKNYGVPLGELGIHGGVNRSLEDSDGDADFSGFAGLDFLLGKWVVLLAEYDFAVNNNGDATLGTGSGVMNLGGRWLVSDRFSVGLDLRDVSQDGQRNPHPERQIRLMYSEKF